VSRLGADPDFRRLWAGQSISVFGTLVTRTALPFTALFVLHAGPLDVALLAAADLVAGVVFGLVAGAWVDRLPRRRVMIVADLGRAALLASVPAMAALGVLRLEALYGVAFLTGALTVWFDVAYHAHLPFLVPPRDLVEANSRLAASASVAEVGAFGIGGWLVQWLSAPRALIVDAVSFLVSAAAIGAIRKPEPPPAPAAGRAGLVREIREGFRALAGDPRLLAIATSEVAAGFAMRLFGTLILVFATRELGLAAGVQGMIYAVGGVTSLTGALLAGPVARATAPAADSPGGSGTR
jgi:MFS family permease